MLIFYYLEFLIFLSYIDAFNKPLGVSQSKLSFYRVDGPLFTCIDGLSKIDWSRINDDYCDCADGSDEPGTSACSNGFFYCENKNHRPQIIPSSRVNDGFCDCCDGSDEYWKFLPTCNNTCWEIGRAAREAMEEKRKLMEEGRLQYKDIVKQAQESISSAKEKLASLISELAEAERRRSQLDESSDEADKPAKEILNRQNETHQKDKSDWLERKNLAKIELTFRHLDEDLDSLVTLDELQSRLELDRDFDGRVSLEEAQHFMGSTERTSVDFESFKTEVWPQLEGVLRFSSSEPGRAIEAPNSLPPPPAAVDDGEPQTDEELDAADLGLDLSAATTTSTPPVHFIQPIDDSLLSRSPFDQEPGPPPVNHEEQAVLDRAELARKEAREAADSVTRLTEDKNRLENLLRGSYGVDSAMFLLAQSEECFEVTEREYVYQLCPFKTVVQRGVNEAKDAPGITLGRFHSVTGTEHLYNNGLACWNGPNRSVRVSVLCGPQNLVKQAQEPSRCEYTLTFVTPAACDSETLKAVEAELLAHDEL